ncbi:MAG: methylated-DNA--[protein]-cysteine S-methyltransferase [Abditibacteriales bacterium]|nr:methylated-DNA--[protein]-cysteine S-methyltransferase [Abditibacteriales bacterium]MDW8365463.1 methylated-DNA--[protein]-cysteine S-methyltransferase [Abditibacteriales bacterium]
MAHTIVKTRYGFVGVAASAKGIRRVLLPRAEEEAVRRELNGAEDNSPQARAWVQSAAEKLQRYFRGESVEFNEPLDWDGAPAFYCRVWNELLKVGRGETVSYAELARRVGASRRAARAVGQAMAHNPIPVIVPCHRVLRSDGSLGGFGGGLRLKRKMLELEGVES